MVRRLSGIVVSALARVEVPAALWRKHRLGELAAEEAGVLVEEFEWDWFGSSEQDGGFAVLRVTDAILEEAARSVARHPLRAYEAIQLASALVARSVDEDLTEFSCFDVALASAARAEGFTLRT